MQFFSTLLITALASVGAVAHNPFTTYEGRFISREDFGLQEALSTRDFGNWDEILEDALYARFAEVEYELVKRDALEYDSDFDLRTRDDDIDDAAFSTLDLIRRDNKLEVFIAFARKNANGGQHWMLLTTPENSNEATWYHVTGGPTKNMPFTLEIQAGKRKDSFGIASTELIGTIADSDKNKLKAAAQSIPMPDPQQGQHCQHFVINLIEKLESKSMIDTGTAAKYKSKMIIRTPPSGSSTQAILAGESASMDATSGKGGSSSSSKNTGIGNAPTGKSGKTGKGTKRRWIRSMD